jgi:hypothetical protein
LGHRLSCRHRVSGGGCCSTSCWSPNAQIGIAQELRAKMVLDRLAVLSPPGPGDP